MCNRTSDQQIQTFTADYPVGILFTLISTLLNIYGKQSLKPTHHKIMTYKHPQHKLRSIWANFLDCCSHYIQKPLEMMTYRHHTRRWGVYNNKIIIILAEGLLYKRLQRREGDGYTTREICTRNKHNTSRCRSSSSVSQPEFNFDVHAIDEDGKDGSIWVLDFQTSLTSHDDFLVCLNMYV